MSSKQQGNEKSPNFFQLNIDLLSCLANNFDSDSFLISSRSLTFEKLDSSVKQFNVQKRPIEETHKEIDNTSNPRIVTIDVSFNTISFKF